MVSGVHPAAATSSAPTQHAAPSTSQTRAGKRKTEGAACEGKPPKKTKAPSTMMEPGAAEESSNTSEDRGWGSLTHTLDNHSIQLAATVMMTTAMTLPPQKNFSVEDTTTTSTTGETMNFPVEGALYLPSQFNVTQEEGTPAIVAGDILQWLIPYQQQ